MKRFLPLIAQMAIIHFIDETFTNRDIDASEFCKSNELLREIDYIIKTSYDLSGVGRGFKPPPNRKKLL